MTKFLVLSSLLMCGFFNRVLLAAETDNYSTRLLMLDDSEKVLEASFDGFLHQVQDSLAIGNKQECDVNELYKAAFSVMGRHYIGRIESYINNNPQLFDRYPLADTDTIYGPFLFSWVPLKRVIATTIRLGDKYVGADKFGHFITEGWTYFRRHYLEGMSLEEAMNYGFESETGIYGLGATGVFSYPDLVANFNGMRFWVHLTGSYIDPLTKKLEEPFFRCEEKRFWRVNKSFRLNAYLDEGWDEGRNCVKLKDQKMLETYVGQIQRLSNLYDVDLTCPIDMTTSKRDALKKKYGRFFPYLFNFQGHGVYSTGKKI
jgi:hypothetical protein